MTRIWRIIATGLLVLSLSPTSAWAVDECADNPGHAEWVQHTAAAEASAETGAFLEAAAHYMDAWKLCAEDPALEYNIARMYQKADDCERALQWYGVVLQRKGSSDDATLAQIVQLSETYVAELEPQCSGAQLEITCQQEGVSLQIGDRAETCPFSDRIDAGTYPLEATLPDHETYMATVEARNGERSRMVIPELRRTKASMNATLGLECGGDLSQLWVSSGGSVETVPCPSTQDVPPGRYTVTIPGTEITQVAELAGGETVRLFVVEPEQIAEDKVGIIIGLRAAPGTGVVQGDLLDKDGDPIAGGTALDGLEPGLFTFAVINELGYAFSDNFALLAQTRIDVINFSVLVSALARYSPYAGDDVSIRIDAGVGAGTSVFTPVQLRGEDATYLTETGPVVATLGIGLAWHITSSVALALHVENRVGFPKLGFIFDFASTGIEVSF